MIIAFKPGDICIATGRLSFTRTLTSPSRREINHRLCEPFRVMILGYSFRVTGLVVSEEYERWIEQQKLHPVWICQPLKEGSSRYRKAIALLEEDLVLLEE